MVLLPFWQTCEILRERPKSCQRRRLPTSRANTSLKVGVGQMSDRLRLREGRSPLDDIAAALSDDQDRFEESHLWRCFG